MRMIAGLEIPRLLIANVSPQPTNSPLAPRSTCRREFITSVSLKHSLEGKKK